MATPPCFSVTSRLASWREPIVRLLWCVTSRLASWQEPIVRSRIHYVQANGVTSQSAGFKIRLMEFQKKKKKLKMNHHPLCLNKLKYSRIISILGRILIQTLVHVWLKQADKGSKDIRQECSVHYGSFSYLKHKKYDSRCTTAPRNKVVPPASYKIRETKFRFLFKALVVYNLNTYI